MTVSLRRPPTTLTIGQLCREFEVTPRTLRYYEEQGLLEPARRDQQRIYSRRDRARLQLILRGRRVGLSLAQIRQVLDLHNPEDGDAVQNAVALRAFQQRIAALEQQRAEVIGAIESLQAACERLEARL
ncbi:MAG: MerR family DNA-binding transcriptional regulator [Pseudomonadota bacterium]|uniref:MerR family transcriptional regulator n=1 Tax=Phenylobacterium sp. TaxID=1871053 RepID=UPI00271E2104|nr:MerR family DNA-binding transcriptional regulator [Phenylobacterium sp.]MDO8379312.1 MerR family DNA-binding transcriptional regulator [Phenylobacterium sp.]